MARSHLNTESGSVIDFVQDGENRFRLGRDYPSDYISLVRTATGTLQASLRTGFMKEFKLIRGVFRLTRVTDRNGNTVRLIYDGGFLAKMQNTNHWITITRDKKGRFVLAQDDQGRKVRYGYDDKGRLAATDDLAGKCVESGQSDKFRASRFMSGCGRCSLQPLHSFDKVADSVGRSIRPREQQLSRDSRTSHSVWHSWK